MSFNQSEIGKGKRYNQGKLRYDLISPIALEELAKVMTNGAEKYGEHNWRKGMNYTSMIASALRHLMEINKGNDIDDESGLHHSAHVMANMMMLTDYYTTYKCGDDRIDFSKTNINVAVSFDRVLADFDTEYYQAFGDNDYSGDKFIENMKMLNNNEDFWERLSEQTSMEEFAKHNLIPTYCIVDSDLKKKYVSKWLLDHGYPCLKLITTNEVLSKSEPIHMVITAYVSIFNKITEAGIPCRLLDNTLNRGANVGNKRLFI